MTPLYAMSAVLMVAYAVIFTLLRRRFMQSCIAFYLAIVVFDAVWALFMADLGAGDSACRRLRQR